MNTFDIAVRYLKDIDFSFWDITKKPEEQQEMCDIIKLCYDRFMSDKNNIVSNETYRSTVFEVATCHMIDLAHDRTSSFLVACQICRNNEMIFTYDNYELRGAYPKVMWDEWDKYCAEQNPTPLHLVGELSAEIFSVAYEYTFNPEPPRIFIRIRKLFSKTFFFPYLAIATISLGLFWFLCLLITGRLYTEFVFNKLLHVNNETKDALQLTVSILLWTLIILTIIKIV